MKVHTTNYFDTLIEVAEDCPVSFGEIPPTKGETKTVSNLQFDILSKHPYQFTSDEVLFQIYALRNELTPNELEKAREAYFSKGQACFRSSPLAKRYGWGIHSDDKGRIAMYGIESEAYQKFLADKSVKKEKAMRSKRV